MNRLFTYGCSYTNYHWPTWADYLGYFFDSYEKNGKAACGNRYIFNRICKDVFMNNITKDDTIIVQWTGLGRNDYVRDGEWKCQGDVFDSSEIYDDDYIEKYFSFNHHVTELVGYYRMLISLFNSIGCNYRFLHMMNPQVDNWSLMGEPLAIHFNNHLRKHKVNEFLNDGELVKTFSFLLSDYTFSPSIWEYQSYIQSESESNNYSNESDINVIVDYHPTSKSHLRYTLEILLKEFNINVTDMDLDYLHSISDEWDSKFKTNNHLQLIESTKLFTDSNFKL